ncbi:MAG: bifunctional glycosyltransferase family 2/GtrA family protein [Eubacteriales bacterium]|nr:bifunctional glycosyltransferase family 2/GtrA family protein [Eubacteriales bacterium]
METVIIIPAYHPDEILKQIVRDNWEQNRLSLVVDDGSGAAYQGIFEDVGEMSIVLHHDSNKGKGEAIKTALAYIETELWNYSVIGIMDADGQHLVSDMGRLLEEASAHPGALILGVRTIDKTMPWKSRVGNLLTRKIFSTLSGVNVSDTQTGMRAFTSELLRAMLDVSGQRYEYETNVLLMCAKEKIAIREVPIETIYHDKENSCSHFRKVRDSLRIYKDLLKFVLSSFSSFVLDYMLFFLLTLLLPKTAWALACSNIGARMVSALYNYWMNCNVVFHQKGSLRTLAGYVCLAASILVLNHVILHSFVFIVGIPVYPAKLLTELLLFVISWMVQNKLIFRAAEKIAHKRKDMALYEKRNFAADR